MTYQTRKQGKFGKKRIDWHRNIENGTYIFLTLWIGISAIVCVS